MGIEIICGDYQDTISALGVLATFLSVLLSLYLSNRPYKPKIIAFINFGNMSNEPELTLDLVWISVVNQGDMPVSIDENFFEMDGRKIGVLDSKTGLNYTGGEPYATYHDGSCYDSDGNGYAGPICAVQKTYPVLLSPGQMENFYLFREQGFLRSIRETIDQSKIKWILNIFQLVPYPVIRIVVHSKFKIRAKYSKEVKEKIVSGLSHLSSSETISAQ